MEYIESGDLQHYVGTPMPEAEMQLIVSQVLEGLAYMHGLNYAHRDLKPAVCGCFIPLISTSRS
jgi:serine/threonine protein kinase